MSSRADYRRRERSWEREDRDRDRDRYSRGSRSGTHREGTRRRDSRSPSPRRDRYDYDRKRDRDRDYKASRRDDRRDYDLDDRRPDRRSEKRDERKSEQRVERRERDIPERGTQRDKDTREKHLAPRHQEGPSDGERVPERTQSPPTIPANAASKTQPDTYAVSEEGEEMDVTNDDGDAIMAMMGLTGFGSTKGKHVEGNQEGSVGIKKMRTWRQYMNRRGGFNRPLDKIK